MRLPNGYGSVIKMSGKRRKPYAARKTAGWHYDKEKDKQIQDFVISAMPKLEQKHYSFFLITIIILMISQHRK